MYIRLCVLGTTAGFYTRVGITLLCSPGSGSVVLLHSTQVTSSHHICMNNFFFNHLIDGYGDSDRDDDDDF